VTHIQRIRNYRRRQRTILGVYIDLVSTPLAENFHFSFFSRAEGWGRGERAGGSKREPTMVRRKKKKERRRKDEKEREGTTKRERENR